MERKKEENKLKMVFRLFDKDKDGYLDADELSGAMKYALSFLFSSLLSSHAHLVNVVRVARSEGRTRSRR